MVGGGFINRRIPMVVAKMSERRVTGENEYDN
jgi:hypothetical protein